MLVGAYRIDAKLGEADGLQAVMALDTRAQKRVWLLVGQESQLSTWTTTLLDNEDSALLSLHDYNPAQDDIPAHLALVPKRGGHPDDFLPLFGSPVAEWLAKTPQTWLNDAVSGAQAQETRVLQLVVQGNVPQALQQLSNGRYVISELLGQGGMGKVYRAKDERLHREVAIKVMIEDDKNMRMRFHREARALGRLHHPNIVEVIEYSGSQASLPYLVLEFVDGATVAQVIALARAPAIDAMCITSEVADALVAVHAAGLVHRDLKPENIFVNEQGRVVLGDFGIVRGLDRDNKTGTFVRRKTEAIGSPLFASPEQVIDPDRVEGRSDVFSLGSFMFAMMTGKSPFFDKTPSDVLTRLARGTPPTYPADMDPFVVMWLKKMLAQDFRDRPHAADVVQAFREELARRGIVDRRARVRAYLGTSSGMTGDMGGQTSVMNLAQLTQVKQRVPINTTNEIEVPSTTTRALTTPAGVVARKPLHPAVWAVGGFLLAAVLFGGVLVAMRPAAPAPPPVTMTEEPPVVRATPPPVALPEPNKIDEPAALPPEPPPAPVEKPDKPKEPVVVDRRPATVRFITKPFADVIVDGKKLGTTPIFKSADLSPGTHKLRFENPKFQAKEMALVVKPGEARDVRVELERP